jgi:hypothetical protein
MNTSSKHEYDLERNKVVPGIALRHLVDKAEAGGGPNRVEATKPHDIEKYPTNHNRSARKKKGGKKEKNEEEKK